mmetsp:Transcript_27016/g.62773  ORF Transcript_27016/g.62773 Transcript_27016/m.62773 type:complete len:84 (+) Transcript_27016:300-551(+)
MMMKGRPLHYERSFQIDCVHFVVHPLGSEDFVCDSEMCCIDYDDDWRMMMFLFSFLLLRLPSSQSALSGESRRDEVFGNNFLL